MAYFNFHFRRLEHIVKTSCFEVRAGLLPKVDDEYVDDGEIESSGYDVLDA